MARHHGRHRPEKSNPRHHPLRLGHQHRYKLHSRLRRPRHRRLRNRLLLPRPGPNLTLSSHIVGAGLAPPGAASLPRRNILCVLNPLSLNSSHGPHPRPGPPPPDRRHSPDDRRRPSLFQRPPPLPPGPPARRHRPSQRTHYLLLPNRNLDLPQHRFFPHPLARVTLPPLTCPSHSSFTK